MTARDDRLDLSDFLDPGPRSRWDDETEPEAVLVISRHDELIDFGPYDD